MPRTLPGLRHFPSIFRITTFWKLFAEGCAFGLDQDNPNVREGMRITFELLKQMNEICRQITSVCCRCLPTKEMVFSEYIEHNSKVPMNDVIDKLLVSERSARAQTFQAMTDNKIPYVDSLPGLKKSVGEGLYASSAGDMHPNRNGYRVIGEAVAEYLKHPDTGKQPAASN